MIVASTAAELRRELAAARRSGKRIGFVPTMGNLHAGHIKLIEVARRHADVVVASIYVNPMQFGPKEDFASYPRTPEQDHRTLDAATTDLLFMPSTEEMYPRGMAVQTFVEVPALGEILCGSFRPGHFRGVTTVVNRLFNMVQPDVAVFGKKDYQQLMLIRLMVSDLGIPIEVIGVDTVRENDGLAISSRNNYLQPAERAAATGLYVTLLKLRDEIMRDKSVLPQTPALGMQQLERRGFRPDYVAVVRRQDLSPATAKDRELAILAAAWLGRTRLIDNLELDIA
ncbi:MAG TPA: pantoate--beta-alanine ligase [Burkholderiales bacterium]|nr:pantoate--beta-alanine ligase [Burkholderiales bacterium]